MAGMGWVTGRGRQLGEAAAMYERMPFGMYRGELLGDVPTSYLGWLIGHVELRPWLRDAVLDELDRRAQPGRRGPDVRAAVAGWFRALARKYHPDMGGSDLAMRVVNDAHETLLEALGVRPGDASP